jgi:hypothetical protein
MRPWVAELLSYGQGDYVRPLGIESEINALLAEGGRDRLQQNLPDAWLDQMAIVGTPSECATSVRRLIEAGANSVVLVPERSEIDGLNSLAAVLA